MTSPTTPNDPTADRLYGRIAQLLEQARGLAFPLGSAQLPIQQAASAESVSTIQQASSDDEGNTP